MEPKSVPVTTEQSVKWRLNLRDFKAIGLRIIFGALGAGIGSAIAYFKQTVLPQYSDEFIISSCVMLAIGLLESLKQAIDGPTQQVANAMASGELLPEGYVRTAGFRKID